MRELRVAAAAQGLLLTAALRASPTPGTHADVKAVADLVDWINLMTCGSACVWATGQTVTLRALRTELCAGT